MRRSKKLFEIVRQLCHGQEVEDPSTIIIDDDDDHRWRACSGHPQGIQIVEQRQVSHDCRYRSMQAKCEPACRANQAVDAACTSIGTDVDESLFRPETERIHVSNGHAVPQKQTVVLR